MGVSEETGVKRVCQEPENGRPGDWLCPGCGHHNWSFRDVCQKCFTNKEGEKTAEEPQKPGDWNCPKCAHLNYAFRTSCQRCYTPKPFAAGAGAGGAAGAGRPGDWNCPNCGDLVYASRYACRKCNTPKMMAGAGGGYGMGAMGAMGAMGMGAMGAMGGMGAPKAPPKEMRPGDWACVKCFDINYASRTVCRLCNTPKPPAGDQSGYGAASMYGGYGDMSQMAQMGQMGQMPGYGDVYGQFTMGVNSMGAGGGGGAGRRHGDWDCPNCGDIVYASRSECRKCSAPKPDHLGAVVNNPTYAKPNGGLGASRRAGDWDCPNCGDVQYASRTECRKCRTAKPEL